MDFTDASLYPTLMLYEHRWYTAHLWDLGSQTLVLLGVFQEADKLQDLHLGLVAASDILESNASVVFYDFGFGFAHAEGVPWPSATAASEQRPPACGEHHKSKQR